jgi:hypothetical protein
MFLNQWDGTTDGDLVLQRKCWRPIQYYGRSCFQVKASLDLEEFKSRAHQVCVLQPHQQGILHSECNDIVYSCWQCYHWRAIFCQVEPAIHLIILCRNFGKSCRCTYTKTSDQEIMKVHLDENAKWNSVGAPIKFRITRGKVRPNIIGAPMGRVKSTSEVFKFFPLMKSRRAIYGCKEN